MTNKEKGTTPPPDLLALPESVVTDEMVERAALAMLESSFPTNAYGHRSLHWENNRHHYIRDARAAIESVAAEMWRAANARAEGLEADARRYRWLRDNCTVGSFSTYEPGFRLNCDEPASEWDAAIDAAQAVRSEASEGDNDGR